MAELAKDLDFDFDTRVFQNLFGAYPIEQAIEIFQVWESNFVYYAIVSNVFTIQKLADWPDFFMRSFTKENEI